MISEELLTAIDAAVQQHQRVVCISPRRGFSSYTACRACGTTLTCPHCGRVASLFRGVADEARCRSCKTTVPLSVSCPRCGSTQWSFHGLGVEQAVFALTQLRPDLTISPVIRLDITSDVSIDTYQAYRLLRKIPDLASVILLSGDSLLTSPDYSVAERAWQYLARLQAEAGSAPVLVQTWQPESPFWQRWVGSDDRSWYDDELQQRQRLHVPPFSRQWIAAWRGPDDSFENKIKELRSKFPTIVDVEQLTTRQNKTGTKRLLITWQQNIDDRELPWRTVFPLPWHLDRDPISWVD